MSELDAALATLSSGGMVVVADEADRENEGDLIMLASAITRTQMAFFLRHGSGIVCTPMTSRRAAELDLPPMVETNTDNHGTAFTVSVDHVGTGTGISASDRTATVRALGDPASRADDFRRPGHLFPLRARAGGVLERPGHTEAALDLLALAEAGEVAVITELVDDEGEPLSGARLQGFADLHGLPFVSVSAVTEARRPSPAPAAPVASGGAVRLPMPLGAFRASCFTSAADGVEHLALTLGDVATASVSRDGVLVRVHSECLTGDVFGSQRCDCGTQLASAMERIAQEGAGVLVYLRGHEGRGIGLAQKLRTYALQERGHDTVDANTVLGLPVDDRDYGAAAAILGELGVRRVRLVTNNPAKSEDLAALGVEVVDQVHLPVAVTPDNVAYLRTKADRLGHQLDLPSVLVRV